MIIELNTKGFSVEKNSKLILNDVVLNVNNLPTDGVIASYNDNSNGALIKIMNSRIVGLTGVPLLYSHRNINDEGSSGTGHPNRYAIINTYHKFAQIDNGNWKVFNCANDVCHGLPNSDWEIDVGTTCTTVNGASLCSHNVVDCGDKTFVQTSVDVLPPYPPCRADNAYDCTGEAYFKDGNCVCPAGEVFDNGCTPCSGGTYADGVCKACPLGKTSTDSASECTDCAAGLTTFVQGATECTCAESTVQSDHRVQTSVEGLDELSTVCTSGSDCYKTGKYKLENDLTMNIIKNNGDAEGENLEIIGVNYPVLKVDTINNNRYVNEEEEDIPNKMILRHIHVQPQTNDIELQYEKYYLFDDVIFSGFTGNVFRGTSYEQDKSIVFTNCRFVGNALTLDSNNEASIFNYNMMDFVLVNSWSDVKFRNGPGHAHISCSLGACDGLDGLSTECTDVDNGVMCASQTTECTDATFVPIHAGALPPPPVCQSNTTCACTGSKYFMDGECKDIVQCTLGQKTRYVLYRLCNWIDENTFVKIDWAIQSARAQSQRYKAIIEYRLR